MKIEGWNLTSDVDANNYKLVDKIRDSNEPYFITGPEGSGKIILLNQIQSELTKQNKKILLCVLPICQHGLMVVLLCIIILQNYRKKHQLKIIYIWIIYLVMRCQCLVRYFLNF
jgi:hypothetical protein